MPDARTILACLGCVAQEALEVLAESGLERVTITADASGGMPYWDVVAVDAEDHIMTHHAFPEVSDDGEPVEG